MRRFIALTQGSPLSSTPVFNKVVFFFKNTLESPPFLQCAQTSVDTTRTELNEPIGQTVTNPNRHPESAPDTLQQQPWFTVPGSVKAAACGGLRRDVILCVFPQQRLNETRGLFLSLAAVVLVLVSPKCILPCCLPIIIAVGLPLRRLPLASGLPGLSEKTLRIELVKNVSA